MTFGIYSGDQLVRTESLTEDVVKVGKLPSSHLCLEGDSVSRMHAVIEATAEGSVRVIDLGSAAGTLLNGKKVDKAAVQNGDTLHFGEVKVVVTLGAAAAVAPRPAPPPPVAPPPPAAADPFAPKVDPFAPKANPFAPSASPFAAPVKKPAANDPFARRAVSEDPKNFEYGIEATGAPVAASEVEVEQQAVEVQVRWERTTLHVEHLSPPRAFYVGEPAGPKDPIGFLLGSEALGFDRLPICAPAGAGVAAIVPPGADVTVTEGGRKLRMTDLQSEGRLQASAEMPGAQMVMLGPDAEAEVRHRSFVFVTRPVRAGKRIGGGFTGVDWVPIAYIGASMALFGLLLLMFYFAPPRPASLSLDLLNTDSRLVKYLMEPPETVEETPEFLDSKSSDSAGGKGKRHKDDEGQMGKKDSKKTNNRYAIEGNADPDDQKMARESAKEMARNAGVLGTLRAMAGSWNSPTSPFGADTAIGADSMSALGALMGDQPGENLGFGGLGLRGTGRGGGGTGEGTIGLGNLGTIGHGAGGGDGSGYGRGAGGFRGRSARVPQIKSGAADVRGSLSKEVIRRVIRRHINEVRFCYEQELNARPDLTGRVTVKFIISPTGAVQTALVSDTSLGNQRVENCIAGAVRRWTFPAPDGGGIVIVNYPFMLEQS